MLPGSRSGCARVRARPCQGCKPCLRAIAASGLVLATQEAGNVTGQTSSSPNERHPGALVLVALAGLGEDERVRAVGVRDQRRRLARERRLALAARDVRVPARGGELVVVALERAVTREGVVVRVRGHLVDL